MFEVTEKATEMVTEFFKTRNEVQPLRVFVAGMGCSGVQLGMALDQAGETDEIFEIGGHTYLVEKELLEQAKPIKVDYIVTSQGEGFIITTGIKAGSGCGGGCCGC
ncbi:MAG TPA: IscA/HesB family protein [Deltaproteobacteria bacterium]|nr:IscA/HesB family protein [Deltaproteobacteria bacterium]